MGWGLGVGVSGCVQWSVFAKVFERNAAKKKNPQATPPSPQGPLKGSSPVRTLSREAKYLIESGGGGKKRAECGS